MKNNITVIQLFVDEMNDILHNCVTELENSGYRVEQIPTTGPPALWYGNYQLTGQNRIVDFIPHIL